MTAFLGDAESLKHVLPQQGKATGLAAAVRMRCLKCLDVMLKFAKPADLTAALSTAASMGDTAVFRRLADLAAPLPNPDGDGFTILMRASAGEHASPEIVQALLDRGRMSMPGPKLARRLSTTRSATEIRR